MKKLFEHLGIAPKNGEIGIEIECEGKNLKIPSEEYWITEDDGSLRGAFPGGRAEYVLNGVFKYEDVIKAIEHLNETQEESTLNFSFRTSTHVHLNVCDCTENEIENIIYTYFLLENVFLQYCGAVRIGNRFCLRLADAEHLITYVNHFFKNGFEAVNIFSKEHIKYAALNLAALPHYGSLEFRGMRGTMDPEILLPWIRAILSIKKYAKGRKTVANIHDDFTNMHGKKFIQNILGEDAKYFIDDNFNSNIAEAYSISYDLLHKWKQCNKIAEKKKVKKQVEKGVFKINPEIRGLDPPQHADLRERGDGGRIPPVVWERVEDWQARLHEVFEDIPLRDNY